VGSHGDLGVLGEDLLTIARLAVQNTVGLRVVVQFEIVLARLAFEAELVVDAPARLHTLRRVH